MTTRIRGWGSSGPQVGPDLDPRRSAAQHQVTKEIIDEAVESVFDDHGVAPDVATVMRRLMAADPRSGVAHAYYHGIASAGLQKAHLRAVRKEMVIPYVLDDEGVAALAKYAPEYKLVFKGNALHDHPRPAASRMIDQALVESRVPPGASYTDIGGSPLHHAKAANVHVHIDMPLVDRKDPSRSVQREHEMRVLASDDAYPSAVREYASRFLDKDPKLVCGKRAEECDYKSFVGVSVHVYDVEMSSWPTIMENKGMRLVEGCMLFSPKMFCERTGELEIAAARYEVDPVKNLVRMGFVNSPSWWYEHKWTEYLKYGADQILKGKKNTYSYKVVERRGDTIFFRILQVASETLAEYDQVYRLPQVRTVQVNGFDIRKRKGAVRALARREYSWPEPLWEDMLSHASLMVERGTLDAERLFNYYRTVAPRQTINATLVAGGYEVPMDELAPLVIHVALAAAASVFGAQAASRYQVGVEISRRARQNETTVYKLLSAFGKTVEGFFGVMCLPLQIISKLVEKGAIATLKAQMLDWAPEVVCRPISAKLILRPTVDTNQFVVEDADFHSFAESRAPFDVVTAAMGDPSMATVVLDLFEDALPERVKADLERVKKETESRVEVAKVGVTSAGLSTVGGTTAVPSAAGFEPVDKGSAKQRRDAVLEAIVESEMEQRKVQASCAVAYRTLMSGGRPSVKSMRQRQEEFRNPDYWWVENGVLVSSEMGMSSKDFQHSAVYVPRADSVTGAFVRPVYTERFAGGSGGKQVDREHIMIADGQYTGWAFVNDSLQVYNGPEIVDCLKSSLNESFDFEVLLEQGPPGCGKTTHIVEETTKHSVWDDVVLCPVRKSVGETKERLLKKRPDFAKDVRDRVRTLDSYLVNRPRNKALQQLRPLRVLADEGFMTHAGKWYAATALMGASVLRLFGDSKQIPHVPRAEAPKQHVRVRSDVVVESWLTYRCPADAVAAWGGQYDWKVRATSKVEVSLSQVLSVKGLAIPKGCVMMGMYQADKKILRQMYSGCGTSVEIMTVHESQGNTYDHVWLHRFDNRRRQDSFSLYDKPEYVLVAMSRHTKGFIYVAPDLGDLVAQWIKRGKDVRRVNAAKDVETAGTSKEFG